MTLHFKFLPGKGKDDFRGTGPWFDGSTVVSQGEFGTRNVETAEIQFTVSKATETKNGVGVDNESKPLFQYTGKLDRTSHTLNGDAWKTDDPSTKFKFVLERGVSPADLRKRDIPAYSHDDNTLLRRWLLQLSEMRKVFRNTAGQQLACALSPEEYASMTSNNDRPSIHWPCHL